MKSIKQANVKRKKVLVRGDLDIPLRKLEAPPSPRLRWAGGNSKLEVADNTRIKAMLPTLRFLMEQEAKVILCGHLDRPRGEVVEELRFDPVAKELSKHLGAVHKLDDCVGAEVENAVKAMEPGDIILLENLRFHPEEEKNDPEFAEQLASLADIYVNEAFATCHQNHASIVGLPKLLPAYAGLRLAEEIETLGGILKNPKRPLVFIIGGAKEKEKAAAAKGLSKISDKILLGGLLIFDRKLEGIEGVVFPTDSINACDIGPKTTEMFTKIIKEARTVVWAGPLGKFEETKYSKGTRKIAEVLANHKDAETVAGGGDTIAALDKFGVRDEIDFVSVGGSAMLRFLAGESLPGLAALGWNQKT